MSSNVLSSISQRGDLLEKVDGTEDASSQRISISKIGRNVLSSNLNSKIKKEKIEIRKTESKPEPKTAFGKFLKKLGEKIRKLFSSNGEFDLRDKVKEEYGDDIAQAIPDGKVSQKGLDGIRKILDQEIKSFASQVGYIFHKAENGSLPYWEAFPQSVSQTMKPTQKPGVTPQNPLVRKSMYTSSPSMSAKLSVSVKPNQEDSSPTSEINKGVKMQKSVDSSSETKNVDTTDQKILTQKGPSGLFTILQNAGVPKDSKYTEEYKRNPEKLLSDMHIKAETELYDILGAKTYLPFARVVDEKNKFPETPQEREKLVNEVFSELKMTSSKIFDKGFSDEEIRQLIDMEISRNNLKNGKSLCDNDFAYVAAELQRPVLLQVGTKDDPSYILFSPTYKGEYYGHRARDRYPLKAFQNSIHRFSKSELQDKLCEDTRFLESFKNAIFVEKDRDGEYLSAGQELTDSCQNMIAAGDVEAGKRAEVARKAREKRKAELRMEALPHVELTSAEWNNSAIREVLKDALKFKGFDMEGILGFNVHFLKDGVEKIFSLKNIRIYPNPKDDKGAIITVKCSSRNKREEETLELNVSRDALPKSIQSKLAKLA